MGHFQVIHIVNLAYRKGLAIECSNLAPAKGYRNEKSLSSMSKRELDEGNGLGPVCEAKSCRVWRILRLNCFERSESNPSWMRCHVLA